MSTEFTIKAAGYRVELTEGGAVIVTTPAGRSYVVSPKHLTCSCPGFVFRGSCKHLEGVADLLEPLGYGDGEKLLNRHGSRLKQGVQDGSRD